MEAMWIIMRWKRCSRTETQRELGNSISKTFANGWEQPLNPVRASTFAMTQLRIPSMKTISKNKYKAPQNQ